jgi:hypothetical protein
MQDKIYQWRSIQMHILTNESPPVQEMAKENPSMYAWQNWPMKALQMHVLTNESPPNACINQWEPTKYID